LSQPKIARIKKGPKALVLTDWQVWFGYASHLSSNVGDLTGFARNLVANGIGESSYSSDGTACWVVSDTDWNARIGSAPREVAEGKVDLRIAPGLHRVKATFPKLPAGYGSEGIVEASFLRYQENFLFGNDEMPPAYVRIHIGQCRLITPHRTLLVYPQIKLFENGVILLYFRMFAGTRNLVTSEFITKYLNTPMLAFQRVLVPPGVTYWSTVSAPAPNLHKWYRRPETAWDQWGHQKVVTAAVEVEHDADFIHRLVSLSAPAEVALERAASNSFRALEPEILKAACNQLGMDPKVLTDASAFARFVNDRKSSDEPFEDAEQRIRAQLTKCVNELATSAKDSAVNYVRKALRANQETLSGLAVTLMNVAAYVGTTNSAGLLNLAKLAAFGPTPSATLGNHWGGHHHVHLIRFKRQGKTASENAYLYGKDFGSIIARINVDSAKIARQFLPRSTRSLNDFGSYIALNGSLWVHSTTSRRAEREFADPNQGHLVFQHQVKAELLDYAYALHRRIAEAAFVVSSEAKRLFVAQHDLAMFELQMHDASHFGEIRDLLARGLKAYGVSTFRTLVSEAIRTREAIVSNARTRKLERFAIVVSLVLGTLSVPTLAGEVIKPFWAWQGLPISKDQNVAMLIFNGVASALVVVSLGLGYLASLLHAPGSRRG
jgi:hypothetical protein